MRNIVLYIADSLDGFIARENGSVDWLFTDADYGYSEFYNSIDTVLMGMKTYKSIFELGGGYLYKDKKGFVFTRNRETKKEDYVEFIHEKIAEFTRELKNLPGKDIWLVGGGEIIKIFADESLIDQIIISIHPKILGSGIPLFPAPLKETDLKLIGSESFDSGLVQLNYLVVK